MCWENYKPTNYTKFYEKGHSAELTCDALAVTYGSIHCTDEMPVMTGVPCALHMCTACAQGHEDLLNVPDALAACSVWGSRPGHHASGSYVTYTFC